MKTKEEALKIMKAHEGSKSQLPQWILDMMDEDDSGMMQKSWDQMMKKRVILKSKAR